MANIYPRETYFENLDSLSEIFKLNWPKHVVMFSVLKTFHKRMENFPELREKVKIYALSENWKTDGSFILNVRSWAR